MFPTLIMDQWLVDFYCARDHYYQNYNISLLWDLYKRIDDEVITKYINEVRWINERIDYEDGELMEDEVYGRTCGVTPISLFECITGHLPEIEQLNLLNYYKWELKSTPVEFMDNAYKILAWQMHMENNCYSSQTRNGIYYHVETDNKIKLVKLSTFDLSGHGFDNVSHNMLHKWLKFNNYVK